MILHFKEKDSGDRLNINFDDHTWNDLRYNTFFTVTISQEDADRIKEEMDFNMFSYSLEDPAITPEPEPEPEEDPAPFS